MIKLKSFINPANKLLMILASILLYVVLVSTFSSEKYASFLTASTVFIPIPIAIAGYFLRRRIKSFIDTHSVNPRAFSLLVGLDIVLLILLVMATRSPIRAATVTSANREALIILAKFRSPEGENLSVNQNWELNLDREKSAIDPNETKFSIRVESVDTVIDNDDQAKALSDQYNATMIVYGVAQPGRIEARYVLTPRWCEICDQPPITVLQGKSSDLPDIISNDGDEKYVLYFLVSLLVYNAGDHNMALRYLNLAINSVAPERATELNLQTMLEYRGIIYREQGKDTEALADLTQAIDLEPDYFCNYLERAYVYDDLQIWDEGMADYNTAITLDPGNYVVYVARGAGYSNRGLYDEALQDYNKAFSLAPNQDYTYYWRGVTYYTLGRYQDAITDFDTAVRLNPVADTYSHLADAYYALGNIQEAIDNKNHALELDPSNPRYYTDLAGIYYFALQQFEVAINDYDQALQLDPSDEIALFYRGRSYFELGEYDKARADLESAITIKPDDAEVKQWLEDTDQHLGASALKG